MKIKKGSSFKKLKVDRLSDEEKMTAVAGYADSVTLYRSFLNM